MKTKRMFNENLNLLFGDLVKKMVEMVKEK
nr:MAG TPA: hypothetical protein [Bacteriophage sp.]